MTHPITPPPELVQQWLNKEDGQLAETLAARAAQWGADQELEACCECLVRQGWLSSDEHEAIEELRTARRPKPPSLKQQALNDLADAYNADKIDDTTYENIRLALEALPDD